MMEVEEYTSELQMNWSGTTVPDDLSDKVANELQSNPELSWDDAAYRIASSDS